jgi:hypothetical protein
MGWKENIGYCNTVQVVTKNWPQVCLPLGHSQKTNSDLTSTSPSSGQNGYDCRMYLLGVLEKLIKLDKLEILLDDTTDLSFTWCQHTEWLKLLHFMGDWIHETEAEGC